MPAEIIVPALGESVVEATVGRWLKHEGDQVVAGEPVVELETDKVNLEVSASQPGILQSIAHQEGETVRIGDILGLIGDGAQVSAEPPLPAAQVESAPAEQTAPVEQAPAEPARATPIARRVAEDQGVDLSRVQPTGPGGWATKEDVLRAREQQAQRETTQPAREATGNGRQAGQPPVPQAPVAPAQPPAAPTPSPRVEQPALSVTAPAVAVPDREERMRMSRRRLTIARRLVEAQQTAAMLTTFNEIDMTAVMEMRKRWRESFREKHGVGLGFMSFFTKASIGALKAFPRLNAEIQGEEIVLKHYYNIGIAIGAEEGLVVPVLRDADRMTFAEIEKAIEDLARRAREGTLGIEDLRGGTFSITNGGIYGSLLSTPILNPPQVGILGMHKIQERPMAGEGQVVIRPMMYVALTYDHRIVDGREAVQFLVRIKELIEDPEKLLLEG